MSERVEWRVVCADGRAGHATAYQPTLHRETQDSHVAFLDRAEGSVCGPHRIQSRTVTTSEWADADVKVEP